MFVPNAPRAPTQYEWPIADRVAATRTFLPLCITRAPQPRRTAETPRSTLVGCTKTSSTSHRKGGSRARNNRRLKNDRVNSAARPRKCAPPSTGGYSVRRLCGSDWRMNLEGIFVERYRSFVTPQAIKVRPLTLIYGPNGAGKSTVLRMPVLLADSIGSGNLDALNVSGRLACFEQRFEDLRSRITPETAGPMTLGLDFKGSDGNLSSCRWRLHRESAEWERVVVKEMTIDAKGESWSADWHPVPGEERSAAMTYRIQESSGPPTQHKLSFDGLLPPLEISGPKGIVSELRSNLVRFASSVVWLSPVRSPPRRKEEWQSAKVPALGPAGQNLAQILAMRPEVRELVATWFNEVTSTKLVVDMANPREIRLALRRRDQATFDVPVVDIGAGWAQLLPILTAVATAVHSTQDGQFLVAIEEPEAHLHPRTQRLIAARLCSVAAQGGGNFLIETHSEQILLATQLEVLKGHLDPGSVLIYWICQGEDGESQLREVLLDREGNFMGDWPPTALQEHLALAREIATLRLAQAK